MLRVTIEVIPHGTGDARLVGQVDVANTLKGTNDASNHSVVVYTPDDQGELQLRDRASIHAFTRSKLSHFHSVLYALKALLRE